ncbi:MAG: hypothetical protein ACXVGB_00295 [Mycobacteriaceae bacterium]
MALPEDFMEQLAATRDDPNAFSLLVFGTGLHEGQRRYHTDHNGQVNFLLPGNSWGKTEFICRYVLWLGWFKHGAVEYGEFQAWLEAKFRILVASYAYSIAEESFDRLQQYEKNNEAVRVLIARINKQDSEVELTNGTRIDWGSLDNKGKLVEAARYNHLFVDEVGHIPNLSGTYDNVLYPRTLGVGGVVHFFGTPKEYSDPYLLEVYEKGKDGGDGFHYSQSGSVLENEFWSEEEKVRVLKNPRYVRGWEPCEDDDCTYGICRDKQHPILTPVGKQVLLGEFVLAGGLFFNRFHVARLFAWDNETMGAPAWLGEDHYAIPYEENHLYHSAFDLGGNKKRTRKKVGSDATVGFTVDYTTKPWRVVRFDYIAGGDADWEDKYQLMTGVFTDYHLPYLTIDATGQLDSVQEALYNRGVEVEGVHFGGSGNKKFDMLRNLQLVLELEWGTERGALRCPLIPRLRHELEHYVLPDEDIVQDCVMALAMVCMQVAQYELPSHVSGEVF